MPAVAALLALLAALAAGPAAAQTAITLVSNTGQTNGGLGSISRFDHAQAFTTGRHAAGYKLTGVSIQFAFLQNTSASYPVSIWTNVNGSPGTSVSTLTSPAILVSNTLNAYTASGIDLAANTTYFVILDSSSSDLGNLQNTASDNEDSGAQSGWSIANNSLYRGRALTSGNWTTFVQSKKIAITGYAKTTSLSGLMLSHGMLSPTFAAEGATAYTATVPNTVDEITVTATLRQNNATLAYLDENDAALADADAATGHQVSLAVGVNTIKVKVTEAGGTTTKTFTVKVTRTAAVPGAITDLSATSRNTKVVLAWSTPSDNGLAITKFQVAQKSGSSSYSAWADITGSGASTTSHTVTGLTGGTDYTFKVRAVNSHGEAGDSNEADSAPAVRSITLHDRQHSRPYGIGDEIIFLVAFDRAPNCIAPQATPTVRFTLGTAAKYAHWYSGAGSARWGYKYTVVEGDADSDGIQIPAGPTALRSHSYHYGGCAGPALGESGIAAQGPFSDRKVDGVFPTLQSATAELGTATTEIVLTYSERLDNAFTPFPHDFTVMVAGARRTVDFVTVAGTTVTLTLSSAVSGGQTVTVSYGVGTTYTIHDLAGNNAAALTNQAVSIDVPDSNVAARGEVSIADAGRGAMLGTTLTGLAAYVSDPNGISKASYTYQWIRIDPATGAETDISTATSASYTLVNADRGKSFKIKVSFTDDAGNSETLTSNAFFSSPPRDAKAVARDGEILLTWRAPQFWADDIGEYRYRYCQVINCTPSGAWTLFVAEEGSRLLQSYHYTVKNLSNDVSYTFELRLAGAAADGWPTSTFTGTPSATRAPDSVTGLTAKEGKGIAELAWQTPGNGGSPITRYDYRSKQASNPFGNWIAIPGSGPATTSYTVEDLAACDCHKFQVRAVNANGPGEAFAEVSATSTNTPPKFAIAAPRSFSETIGTATSVAMDFGAAVNATDADNDTLTYRLEGSGAASFAIDSTTGQLSTKAGVRFDHEAKPSYTVTVGANDGFGGSPTIAVTVNVDDVSEPPLTPGGGAVSPVQGSDTTRTATWIAPDNTGRPVITSYDVRYREFPDGAWKNGPQDVTGTTATLTGLQADKSYEVQVRGTNAEGDGDWAPTNQLPVFVEGTWTQREVWENGAAGSKARGGAVTAKDGDGDSLTYSLGGDDASSFRIDADSGQLSTARPFDYESKASYSVSVTASDGRGGQATIRVTVNVFDHNEPGTVTLESLPARQAEMLTARLQDPEDDIRYSVWQWRRDSGDGQWQDIAGATGQGCTIYPHCAHYTPVAADVGQRLQAVVNYGDSRGNRKLLESTGRVLRSNVAPVFVESAPERSLAETVGDGPIRSAANIGAPVKARDADGDRAFYALEGEHGHRFGIDPFSGHLKTKAGERYDHEAKSSYAVEVIAEDGRGGRTGIDVTISVSDVDEPPPAPAGPAVTSGRGSATELAVTWTAPSNAGRPAISGYDLRYRVAGSQNWTSSRFSGANGRTVTVGVRRAGTAYEAQVRARNADGTGDWSQTGAGSTNVPGNAAPAFDVASAQRSVAEDRAANLAIGAPLPAATDADSDTLSYRLEGPDASSFGFDATTRHLKTKSGSIYDFERKPRHSLTLIADDSRGGTAALAVTVDIFDADEPPRAPAVRAGLGSSSDSLLFTWTAPVNGGPEITGYDLRYRTVPDGDWTLVSVAATVRNVDAGGLQAGRVYEAQVRAKSAEGTGDWSKAVRQGSRAPANGAPAFAAAAATRSLPESGAEDRPVGAPLPEATDPNADELSYRLEGPDAAWFVLDTATRQLKTRTGAIYDFETKPRHSLTLTADDGRGGTAGLAVTVQIVAGSALDAAPDDSEPPAGGELAGNLGLPATWSGFAFSDYSRIAQTFTTGPHDDGWRLSGVDLRLSGTAPLAPFSVSIHASLREVPGRSLGTLTGPASPGAGVNRFTAPDRGIDLAPDTTYFVTVTATAAGGGSIEGTLEDSAQGAPPDGWRIGSGSRAYRWAGHSWDATNVAMLIRIHGTANNAATGRPAIAGAPVTGRELTAGPGTIADGDGVPDGSAFSWRWVRIAGPAKSATEISGATARTYRPVADDQGRRIAVRAWFTDDAGNAEGWLQSDAVGPVAPAPPNAVTGLAVTAGDGRAELSWETPGDSGSPITKYRILHTIEDRANNAVTRMSWADIRGSDATTTRHTVTDLAADVWHRFRVRAVSAGGEGPASDEVGVTLPGASRSADARTAEARSEQNGFTARFEALPERHDGASAFTFRLHFSAGPGDLSYLTVRDSLFEVTGGTVTAARRMRQDSNMSWLVTVAPSRHGDLVIVLPARACGAKIAANALCLDGAPLAAAVAATVPGPASAQVRDSVPKTAPLTARFVSLPSNHDGASAFAVRLQFSAPVATSYRVLRDIAFAVTGAGVTGARRVNGRSDLWHISVTPASHGAVRLSLPATSDCAAANAVCTSDGRKLSGGIATEIRGPAALSVADAGADEGSGAVLQFHVTLSRAASGPVTVDYATSDGTATAGEDYTGASGMLRFAAGEASRTISVAVLDDAHDEGQETFTLTLSNASNALIVHASATGTIQNTDPMPQAWLARFGRASADHVVEAIAGRWRDGEPETPQTHFTLGGRQVRGLDSLFDGSNAIGAANPALTDESAWARMDRLKDLAGANPAGSPQTTDGFAGRNPPAGGSPAGGSLAGGSPVGSSFAGRNPAGRSPAGTALLNSLGLPTGDLRDVLMGSSFFYSRPLDKHGEASEPPGWLGQWSAWGQAAATRFSGADGPLSLNGEVATAILGVDSRRDRWLAGVTLSHSEGEGAYTHPEAAGGAVSSRLTSLNPYVHYRLNEHTRLWGVLGYGAGALTLTPEGTQAGVQTELATAMAAFGGRGVLSMRSGRAGAFELAVVSDALVTNTESDAAANLMGATGQTSRLRVMLEGSGSMPLGSGAVLRPTLEAGLRYDGGNAETGAGFEVGAGLGYAIGPLAVEINVRALVAHEDTAYEESGFSGSIRYQPRPDGRGLSMKLGSAWGRTDSGVQSLWTRQDASGLVRGAAMNAAQRLQAEWGYGFSGRRNAEALWVPFLGAESAGGGAQSLRAGFRLTSEPNVEMGLELGRRENGRDAPEHAIKLNGSLRF